MKRKNYIDNFKMDNTFSPYFISLLFVLVGISTKLVLQKRISKEYLIERVKRLFVPFLFGTMIFMPIMSYIADKFNCLYSEGFLVGQFWVLICK